jgi:hypothetical protein
MLRVLGERATLALVGPEREVRADNLSETLCRVWRLEIYSRTRRGARGTDVSPRSEEFHDLYYSRYVFFGGMSPTLSTRCMLS